MYYKWKSYDVWFLRYQVRRTEFFAILGHFLTFDSPDNSTYQNFEKMREKGLEIKFWKNEKMLRDIILHLCTTNDNHMMCFLRYGRQNNFFVVLDYISPFYPTENPENQNFEKIKTNPGDIIILHMCTKAYDQMKYGSWDMVHGRRTDRQTDAQKEVSATPVPHLKNCTSCQSLEILH